MSGTWEWLLTFRCGHSFRLLTGVPDLKAPYICQACPNSALVIVMQAIRVEPGAKS